MFFYRCCSAFRHQPYAGLCCREAESTIIERCKGQSTDE
jgi:hypothetical protein